MTTDAPPPCARCVHLEGHFPSGMPFCGRSGLPAKAERRGRLFTNCGTSGRWHQPRASLYERVVHALRKDEA